MELRQLEYFVAVVEEANFTRAAAAVHVAQPGVSAQIRRLERELGQELLDRSGRTVRLTEAGAAVLPYARAALAAVAGAREAVDELTGLLRGHVTIGTVTSISSEDIDLPGLLAGFHADHPPWRSASRWPTPTTCSTGCTPAGSTWRSSASAGRRLRESTSTSSPTNRSSRSSAPPTRSPGGPPSRWRPSPSTP